MAATSSPAPKLVLDASVALAWFFEDERTPRAMAIRDRLRDDPGVAAAPALLWIEVANTLVLAEKRGRSDPARSAEFVAQLNRLSIHREDSLPETLARAADLARNHSLTVYDAIYLEMALRHGVPLATLDARLERAAQASGVGAA